jgi:broad specificity phosphatase PhoE
VAGEIDHEAYKSEEFEDAHLTEKGEAQCESLNVSCLEELTVKNAELLVVSPMRRTLATATKCFPTLVGKIPFLAHESIREQTGEHPCDRRRPITEHSVSYPHVDFSIIKDDEDPLYFKSIERESNESLALRAHDFFDWLAIRQETNIIVVTHSAFLRNTFNLVLDLDLELEDDERSGAFKNCEMKSYMITLPTFKPY